MLMERKACGGVVMDRLCFTLNGHRSVPPTIIAMALPTSAPSPAPWLRRWKDECDSCITTTVWTTHYVDEQGKSTSCTTTDFATATVTTAPTPTPTWSVYTVMQTTTSTLAATSTSLPSAVHNVQVDGAHCDCEHAWLRFLFGGVPDGAGEVVACIAFFIPFLLYFLLCTGRLFRYVDIREVFFVILPFTIFTAVMVAALPTRAYAASHHDTEHIVASDIMIALAVPLLVDVALQVYGLLRKRSEMSGWLDSSSLVLRVMNASAMVLYVIAAVKMGSFISAWQNGMATCASNTPAHIGTILIIAGFLEVIALILGLIGLILARWRLRLSYTPLLIQAHIVLLLFIYFVAHLAHDIAAASAWSKRIDQSCAPLAQSTYNTLDAADDGTFYFFDFDWAGLGVAGHVGMNSQAAFWMIGILPVFLATTLLMLVNVLVYVDAVPELVPLPDSVRYKLCYNENEKKMEFVRLDNPGLPTLADGEPLYEVVRDDEGDGWQIREARVPTVLPPWQNVTMRPWYK